MLAWISGSTLNENGVPSSRTCSLCGYLYKMKKQKKMLVPQWCKRWFSIEGRYLRWYHNSSDITESGSIDLKKVSYITRFEMKETFSFIVGYPDRNLLIRADNLADMTKWIRALQLQADVARGGNGTSLLSSIPSNSSTTPEGKNKAMKKQSNSLEAELERSLKQLNELEKTISLKSDEINLSVKTEYYDYMPKRGDNYKHQPPKIVSRNISREEDDKTLDNYIDQINENDFNRQIGLSNAYPNERERSNSRIMERSNASYDKLNERESDPRRQSRQSSRQSNRFYDDQVESKDRDIDRYYDNRNNKPSNKQSSKQYEEQIENDLYNVYNKETIQSSHRQSFTQNGLQLDRQSSGSKQQDERNSRPSSRQSDEQDRLSNRPLNKQYQIQNNRPPSARMNRSNSKQTDDEVVIENSNRLSNRIINTADKSLDRTSIRNQSDSRKSLKKSDSNESLEEIVDRPVRRPPRKQSSLSNSTTNNNRNSNQSSSILNSDEGSHSDKYININVNSQLNSRVNSQQNFQPNSRNNSTNYFDNSKNDDDEFEIQEVNINVVKTNGRTYKI